MTESRSVAQVQNPVTAPKRVAITINLERLVAARFRKFCLDNGYVQGDVVDAAVSDYMDNFEKIAMVSKIETDSCGGCGAVYDLDTPHDCPADRPTEQFDPFAGGVPE